MDSTSQLLTYALLTAPLHPDQSGQPEGAWMKHRILAIDDGPLGQRCARLYGTTAASIHDELLTSTLTGTTSPHWHLTPRLQHTDARSFQEELDPDQPATLHERKHG